MTIYLNKLVLAFGSLVLVLCDGYPTAIALAGEQSFNVCEGEYQERCPPHEGYAYCGTINDWAARTCRSLGSSEAPVVVKLSDHSGNKCGYGLFRVICK
jgi:hypothetical protein